MKANIPSRPTRESLDSELPVRDERISPSISIRTVLGIKRGQPSRKINQKGVRKLRKILGAKKGIATILAALLMVVIVVVASVMVYAWSTGLLGGLLGTRTSVEETLTMDSFAKVDADTYTLYLRNPGTADVTLARYFIEEGGLAIGTPTDFAAGTTVLVTGTRSVNIDWAIVGGSFVAGHQYGIKVITTKGTQFVFSIIAS